mmetsp:Transcript_115750/g.332519  ORF Transcript_115750/g.332519 Transcript_115750/m.332519 type:complete len:265 (-) Transcript_115750:22-816(-)
MKGDRGFDTDNTAPLIMPAPFPALPWKPKYAQSMPIKGAKLFTSNTSVSTQIPPWLCKIAIRMRSDFDASWKLSSNKRSKVLAESSSSAASLNSSAARNSSSRTRAARASLLRMGRRASRKVTSETLAAQMRSSELSGSCEARKDKTLSLNFRPRSCQPSKSLRFQKTPVWTTSRGPVARSPPAACNSRAMRAQAPGSQTAFSTDRVRRRIAGRKAAKAGGACASSVSPSGEAATCGSAIASDSRSHCAAVADLAAAPAADSGS